MKPLIDAALAFLGQKLDAIKLAIESKSQTLNIDLGKSSEELQRTAEAMGKLVAQMQSNENTKSMGQELAALNGIGHQLAALSDTLKKTTPKMDNTEAKKTNKLIGQLIKDINKSFNPEVVVDMDELKVISKGLNDLSDNLALFVNKDNPQLSTLIELMQKVASKKFEVPDEIKIEEQQFRQLRNIGVGGGGGMGGGTLAGMNPTMANVAMTSADTEYSYTFPKGTTSFYIKLRSQNTKLLFAWATGKLAVSGDASAYMTVSQNGYQSRPNLDLSGKTIYFESGAATQVCEIESYQ